MSSSQDAAAVAGAEADHGERFACEARDRDLAELSVGHGLAGVVVDDFDDVLVLPHVDAFVGGAVHAAADAAGLGHAVDVEGVDA